MSPEEVLLKLLNSGGLSDLQFSCKDVKVKVHKAVVCIQSPVIRTALQGNFKEAASRVIDMDSFDPDVVRRFTEFLYTGDYEEFPAPDTPKAGPAAATTKPEGDGEDQDKDSANEISSSNESVASTDLSNAEHIVSRHLLMNSIGDYYAVQDLVDLANAKTQSLLSDSAFSVSALLSLGETAVKVTGDKDVLDIIAKATGRVLALAGDAESEVDIDADPEIDIMARHEDLLSYFGLRLLASCRREYRIRKDSTDHELWEDRRAIQQYENRISMHDRAVMNLLNAKQCRNQGCDPPYSFMIHPQKVEVICRRCRWVFDLCC